MQTPALRAVLALASLLAVAPLGAQAASPPAPAAATPRPAPAPMAPSLSRVVRLKHDSIVLGERWPGAARFRESTRDTTVVLPPELHGASDGVSVQLDRQGIVRRVDFTYRTPRDIEAIVRGFVGTLGAPDAANATGNAGTPRLQWLWRDDRTEFMIAELRPPLDDVRGIALLIDLTAERRQAPR